MMASDELDPPVSRISYGLFSPSETKYRTPSPKYVLRVNRDAAKFPVGI